MKIWTVDAFTDRAYAGNPAAVTIVEEFPAGAVCQNMATEMNLSETAFVKPLGVDHFHIRWFTPAVEVKLCGHATLAASHILYQEKIAVGNRITLESQSGPLVVYKNSAELTLDFPLQRTGPALDIATFQQILGADVVSAEKALDDVIVELSDEASVRKLKINAEKINTIDCRGLIVTAKAKAPYDFISRFFGPRVGVLEDPVTGSAHCKLADYWQKRLHKTEFFAYQASKRGGELKLTIQGDRLHLTGQAVTIMRGEWLVN